MSQLFKKRQGEFWQTCLGYLRYVLNDHFVLVLMVFLGFLALQYRQLLLDFPETTWAIYLILACLSALLFFSGKIATYVEEADKVFLLPKEAEVKRWVRSAMVRSFVLWAGFQVLGQLVLFPIYMKLGWYVPAFASYLLALTVGKYFWLSARLAVYQKADWLDWDLLVADEKKRQQGILQFFALFTRVKGLTSSVKARAYLAGLLAWVPKDAKHLWDYLFARAFLRSGDFFWLFVRLAGLSLLVLLWIEVDWLVVGLVLLFDYLLLFQLLALLYVYDYQYLQALYPSSKQLKLEGFKRFIRSLLYGLLVVQIIAAFFVLSDKLYLLVLLVGGAFLNQIYLGFKAKKLID